MSASHDAPGPRAYALALSLLAAAALLAIWVPPVPAGLDVPLHMLSADVLAHPAQYEGRFAPHLALTSQGFVWLMVPFAPLGAVVACKIAQTLLVAAYALAFGRAAWLAAPPDARARPSAPLLAIPLALGFVHALGFLNFALAIPAFAMAVGHAMRALREPRAWRAVGVWLAICAVLHIIAAAFAIAQIGGIALVAQARSGERPRRVAGAVIAALPAAAYVIGVALHARTASGWQDVADQLGAVRLPIAEQIAHVLDGPWGGFSGLGGLLVVATLVLAARARWSGDAERDRRAVLGASAAFWLAVYAALPWHAQGWAYAQPRVLVVGFGVAVLLGVWGEKAGRLLIVSTIFGLAYLLSWGDGAHRAGRQVEAVVEGFGEANAGTMTIATLAAPAVPSSRHVTPWLHSGAHAIRTGAANNDRYRFNPAIHSARPAALDPALGAPFPQFVFHALEDAGEARSAVVADVVDRIAERARRWDSVVVVGVSEDMLERLRARGLRPVEGSAELGSAPSAILALDAAALRVTLLPVHDAPLALRLGYADTLGWFDGRGGPAPSGPIEILFERLPAGPLRVEVLEGDRVVATADVVLEAGQEMTLRMGAER